MRISDWSSDVCSSDLITELEQGIGGLGRIRKAIQQRLKARLRQLEILRDVIAFAQPVIRIGRERAFRIRSEKILEAPRRLGVLAVLECIERLIVGRALVDHRSPGSSRSAAGLRPEERRDGEEGA